jgi:hypothetical protein
MKTKISITLLFIFSLFAFNSCTESDCASSAVEFRNVQVNLLVTNNSGDNLSLKIDAIKTYCSGKTNGVYDTYRDVSSSHSILVPYYFKFDNLNDRITFEIEATDENDRAAFVSSSFTYQKVGDNTVYEFPFNITDSDFE